MLRTNTVNRKAEHIKVTKAPLAAAQRKNTQIIMEGKTAILLLIAYMYLKTTTANEGEFLNIIIRTVHNHMTIFTYHSKTDPEIKIDV